ncbi:hypothetical protein [Mastigocoleus sp. MO_188.B34]|uniref:hypothetical protein n=1 Tax=Mastigocoleus sp. MO_188.B34 TaxID=3036635 RepID=UPI002626EC06|nr:hypothetical protein [Mastigocoleus sp. MO_188.B34]MDJ0695095.1 hypothetical protein [Mastigocoleus sp. MO_188.B34]
MDSEKRLRYQNSMVSTYYPNTRLFECIVIPDEREREECSDLLTTLRSGKVLMVNSRRRNGLILFKRYHAEFAGPGAVVGGNYDLDCYGLLPIGNLSLLTPESHEERQKAYLIRRQWVRLIKQITENSVPQQRVQKILDQFEEYFPVDIVSELPSEAFAMLVGVLPQTVIKVRGLASQKTGVSDY